MTLYQGKAQPVGDPADFVEPVFLDGWYIQALQIPWISENAQSEEINPGEPIAPAPPFSTFGWERPTELPLEIHPPNSVPFPFPVIDPEDFVEPIFLDGWYQQALQVPWMFENTPSEMVNPGEPIVPPPPADFAHSQIVMVG